MPFAGNATAMCPPPTSGTSCAPASKAVRLDMFASVEATPPASRGPPPPEEGTAFLPSRVDAFLAHLTTHRSRRTLHSYREELDVVARDARALGLPGDIARWAERDVLALRHAWDGLAPMSLNKRLVVLGGFLAFHGNEIVLTMRERGRLRLPPARRRTVRHVGAEARRAMFGAATPLERAVLALGFGLGLRLSEMAALRLGDVREGVLVVRREPRAGELPLAPAVEREVRAYVAGPRAALVAWARAKGCDDPDPGTLLLHYTRHRLSPYQEDSLGNLLMDLGTRAGVRFSAHDMRRTCATELAEREVAIEVIQEELGHVNLESTRKYVSVRQGELRAALGGYQGEVCEETGKGME
jgi:integrase/recombinase XerD